MKVKVFSLYVFILLLSACGSSGQPKLPLEKDMKAYILVYFKDSDHSLHMAISADGYSFTDDCY